MLLQGDFNAHTSNNDDFLTYDKSDEMFGIVNCDKPLMRNSEDRKPINERGSCLLDLCKTRDFLIVNGRKTGDVFGKYTSFQWNRCRVVDYLLASSPYFDKITKFQVGDFYPWLSDHCPLHYSISLRKHITIKNAEETLKVLPSRFLRETSPKTKFEEILKSETSKYFFKDLANNKHLSPDKFAEHLTEKILTRATACGLKTTRKKLKSKINNSLWYDKECAKQKSDIQRFAKCLKQAPNDNKWREKVFFIKREVPIYSKKN